jgi:hypothetical protein
VRNSDEATPEQLAAGRQPGVSEFFHNRWHMYAMYALGVFQFIIFLYLAAAPYLPYTGQFSFVMRCVSSVLIGVFPLIVIFANPQTMLAARQVFREDVQRCRYCEQNNCFVVFLVVFETFRLSFHVY